MKIKMVSCMVLPKTMFGLKPVKKEWCNQLVSCHLNKIDNDGIFILKEI